MTHAILDITIYGITEDLPHYPFEMTLYREDGEKIRSDSGYIHEEIKDWIRPSLDDQENGQSLFDVFISELLRKRWLEIRDSYEHWHIRLHLADHDSLNALHALPWEYLHDTTGQSSRYIAADRKTPFSRYMPNGSKLKILRKPPIKMLLAIASPINLPDDMAEINVEDETKVIAKSLIGLSEGRAKLEIMERPVTLKNLEAKLREQPFDILHIVGHGQYLAKFSRDGLSHAFLYLSDDDDKIHEVMDDDFAAMLSRLGDQQPQFIFLASCQTAQRDKGDPWQGFAPKLMQVGIPAVLAMQDRVNIPTAQTFVSTFYHGLLQHGYVDLACNEARATVVTAAHRGSHIPVLFSRLPNGKLFQFQKDLGIYEPPIPPAPGDPPYKGRYRYKRDNAHLFFGREKLIDELAKHLKNHTFLAIVGASGSGKSSLARAGLIPALLKDGAEEKHDEWAIYIVEPTGRPFKKLSTVLYPGEKDNSVIRKFETQMMDDPAILRTRLLNILHKSNKKRLLLLVDQFEELFTNYSEPNDETLEQATRHNYILNLLDAAGITSESEDPSPKMNPITVVLTLRADFYANCAEVTALRTVLKSNRKNIGVMSKEEAAKAITGPVGDIWEIQPALVERMLRDIGYIKDQEPEPGSLPLLSHVLRETWDKRSGYAMTLEGYESIGGVRGTIARIAEMTFNQELNEEQKNIALNIFVGLVELGDEGIPDTRRPVKRSELLTHDSNVSDVTSVLDILVKARLVTADEDEVEVAHEALIREWDRLRGWLKKNRDDLRSSRLLETRTSEQLKAGKPNSELLTTKEMAPIIASPKENISVLTKQQEQHLATSPRVDQLSRLWNRTTAILLSALVLISLVLWVSDPLNLSLPENNKISIEGAIHTTPVETVETETVEAEQLPIDCIKINGISEEECNALSALYDNTDGPNWQVGTQGWEGSDSPCEDWYGITCKDGRVIAIDLGDRDNPLGLTGDIPAEIGNLSRLTKLDLTSNHLTSLPTEIGNLSRLTELDLTGNDLSSLPAEIGQLTSLTALSLSSNDLRILPSGIGKLSSLRKLFINSNQLETLPAEIGQLSNLKVLYLYDNGLRTLPPEIRSLSSLESLALSDNQFSTFPGAVNGLWKLGELDLSGNNLGTLPPEIGDLPNLGLLNLSKMGLSSLPAEIGNLVDLEKLYLNGNKLSTLPNSLQNLTNLTMLELAENRLNVTDETLLAWMNKNDPDWADTQLVMIPTPTSISIEDASTPDIPGAVD